MPETARKTILIVEEEDSLRVLVRDLLAQRGYRVIEAASGEIALDLCRDHKGSIDLLITDLVLRTMRGHEIAKEIALTHPTLKTIYLEDHSQSTMIGLGIPLKDLHYLPKPVRLKTLMSMADDLLGAGR
jgi:two-component system cell cycle sensor histidine kinase/response regulator CckA